MNDERDLKHCKVCGELKLRVRSGKYPNNKNPRFADNKGRLWNGATCPDCHVKKQKNLQKGRRKLVALDTAK